MANLATYLDEVSDLVRDSNYQFTSQARMTKYINSARKQVAIRSACLQALVTGQSAFGVSAQPGYIIPGAMIPGSLPNSNPNNANEPGAQSTASNTFTTIPGVELYTYNYATPYLQQQYTGYQAPVFVFNVSVSWGGNRPTLMWQPWDNLQAWYRSWNVGVSSYPFIWSQKGLGESGQVWMFPMPASLDPGEMEWECICTPKPLYTNDDMEAIPVIYQDAVKYYAAYRAYMSMQRTGMAQIMRGLFDEQLLINGVATDFAHAESYYSLAAGW